MVWDVNVWWFNSCESLLLWYVKDGWFLFMCEKLGSDGFYC